jgi:5'-nucleotidase
VLYSGTVAAAMEAALSDVPALAVSLDASTDARDYTFAAEVAARLAARVLQNGLPPSTCLNVNVPARPASEIRGVRVTRLGYRIYRDELIERSDPRGRAYYWIGGEPPTGRVEVEDTDIWAVAHNFVSITPLQFDLTAHAHLKDIEAWARAL